MAQKKEADRQEAKKQEPNPLIIIASNRGPYSFTAQEDGTFDIRRGEGGLVTALGALAQKHEVLWVAAALDEGDRQWATAQKGKSTNVEGTSLLLVIPGRDAYEMYYNTIANPLLWFIHHQLWDLPRYPGITQETWEAWNNGYVKINKLFAEAILKHIPGHPKRPVIILPQDYHLYLVPKLLREALGDRVQIQPFIHIPWPGTDAWQILPGQMRTAILEGLLASDRVGFQTKKDAFNFVQTCRFYLHEAHTRGARDSIQYQGRKTQAIAYPISVDVEKLESLSESTEVSLLKNQIFSIIGDRKLILRVDRIELSKNILRGLEAFLTLLVNHPEYHGKVQMLALLVPSRMGVDEYQHYLQEIMAQAGMINAAYSDGLWEPVRIIVGGNYSRALAAMQIYDVLLVNPLADGMNLVAKEGVLLNQRDGVLVLSENAGAFYELGSQALTVSPYDVYGTSEAIHQALEMPAEEKIERAEALRNLVRKASIKQWFHDQIQDSLEDFQSRTESSSQARKDSTSSTPAASKSDS